MSFLHIYAQSDSHTEAWIVGDRKGLEALRQAIDEALKEDGSSVTSEVAAVDKEGFKALVVQTTVEAAEAKDLRLPYTNATYDKGKHPLALIGPSRYRELVIVPEK